MQLPPITLLCNIPHVRLFTIPFPMNVVFKFFSISADVNHIPPILYKCNNYMLVFELQLGNVYVFCNKISLHVQEQVYTYSRPVLVFFEALVPRRGLSTRRLSTTCLFFNGLLLNFSTTSPFFNIGKASKVNFSPKHQFL